MFCWCPACRSTNQPVCLGDHAWLVRGFRRVGEVLCKLSRACLKPWDSEYLARIVGPCAPELPWSFPSQRRSKCLKFLNYFDFEKKKYLAAFFGIFEFRLVFPEFIFKTSLFQFKSAAFIWIASWSGTCEYWICCKKSIFHHSEKSKNQEIPLSTEIALSVVLVVKQQPAKTGDLIDESSAWACILHKLWFIHLNFPRSTWVRPCFS